MKTTRTAGLAVALLFLTTVAWCRTGITSQDVAQRHPGHATTATARTPAQLQAGFSAAIATDVAASTRLPNGNSLWLGGDVTRVGSTSVQGYYGYPHGAFLETAPGSASFTVLPGKYGTDYWNGTPDPAHYYQQVPNWSDGTYFWMQVPLVDDGTLYVIGERVSGVVPFTILGTWAARFSAATLAYEGISQVPSASADAWSGGTGDGAGGWWLTSQHGELAHVPDDGLGSYAAWTAYPGAVPSSGGSWLARAGAHWDLLAQQPGSTVIQRWTAVTPAGPWSGPVTAGTTPQPDGDGGIAVHPELGAPPGEAVISWLVNNPGYYGPEFGYAAIP